MKLKHIYNIYFLCVIILMFSIGAYFTIIKTNTKANELRKENEQLRLEIKDIRNKYSALSTEFYNFQDNAKHHFAMQEIKK